MFGSMSLCWNSSEHDFLSSRNGTSGSSGLFREPTVYATVVVLLRRKAKNAPRGTILPPTKREGSQQRNDLGGHWFGLTGNSLAAGEPSGMQVRKPLSVALSSRPLEDLGSVIQ